MLMKEKKNIERPNRATKSLDVEVTLKEIAQNSSIPASLLQANHSLCSFLVPVWGARLGFGLHEHGYETKCVGKCV